MKIHTKLLDANSSATVVIGEIFSYAKEVLGDSWTADPSGPTLGLTDSFGNTYQFECNGSANDTIYIVYNGIRTKSGTVHDHVPINKPFTGMVWQTSSGSAGIGFQNSDTGLYHTLFLLMKFDGTYAGKDLYGMSSLWVTTGLSPFMVHGSVDISPANHCLESADSLGSGVYLHPCYDPVSGLVSPDIFGVKSAESAGLITMGSIVKQGGTSYMSILASPSSTNAYRTALFVKM